MCWYNNVRQFQFVQKDLDHFVLNIVCGSEFNKSDEQSIDEECKRVLDYDSLVTVNKVNQIHPNQSSGKHNFTVSNVPVL